MLNKVGTGWKFENEAILEDFLWNNLESFLKLIPIAKQYRTSNSQICDILAKNKHDQLIIIELKNTEDRYIVQQLTRYYEELLQEKAFINKIDYGQPVKLVAFAPTFHKDNFTDIKYHKLDFELWQFKIIEQQDNFYFQILELQSNVTKKIALSYQRNKTDVSIPSPSKPLLNILSKCTKEEKNQILNIRNKFFSFDERIKEISDGSKIVYGKSKNNIFAELRFDSKRESIALFLWLPLVNRKYSIGRMRIWTNWNDITDLGHVPKGLGRMVSQQEYKSKIVASKKRYTVNPSRKSAIAMTFDLYPVWLKNRGCTQAYQEMKNRSNSLEEIIDFAMEIWCRKN